MLKTWRYASFPVSHPLETVIAEETDHIPLLWDTAYRRQSTNRAW